MAGFQVACTQPSDLHILGHHSDRTSCRWPHNQAGLFANPKYSSELALTRRRTDRRFGCLAFTRIILDRGSSAIVNASPFSDSCPICQRFSRTSGTAWTACRDSNRRSQSVMSCIDERPGSQSSTVRWTWSGVPATCGSCRSHGPGRAAKRSKVVSGEAPRQDTQQSRRTGRDVRGCRLGPFDLGEISVGCDVL